MGHWGRRVLGGMGGEIDGGGEGCHEGRGEEGEG